MGQDKEFTDVIFRVWTRKDFKGTLMAFFPHEVNDFNGNVVCYDNMGHSGADYKHCMRQSRMATESEYKDLKMQMEGMGYNLNVVTRQNYDKYLKSYREVRTK